MTNEWDVIVFGDLDEDKSIVKRVVAATSDEALTAFKGRFAVAFPVKNDGDSQLQHPPNGSSRKE